MKPFYMLTANSLYHVTKKHAKLLLFLTLMLISLSNEALAQKLKAIELGVDCIEYIGNDKYVANFWYSNPNNEEINIPQEYSIVKTNNGKAYGHTNFKKGTYHNVFSVEFNFKDRVEWAVLKPGGDPDNPDDYRITSASSSSSHCRGEGDLGLIPIFDGTEEGGVLWPELYYLSQQEGELVSNEIFQIDTIVGAKKVLIEVIPYDETDATTLINELESLGFLRIPEGANPRIYTGLLPISNLGEFNRNPLQKLTKFVRPMYTPLSEATEKSGLVGTQQDRALRSDLVRKAFSRSGTNGIDGSDITMGIISDSYANSEATISSSELSNDVPKRGDSPDSPMQVLSDWTGKFGLFGGTDEGQAMVQIAYDIAPGARFKFATGALSAELMAAEYRRLAQEGCDIVIDDILHLGEPFAPKGQIAQAVEEVVASGVHVMSSAGNYKDHSVLQNFKSAPIPSSFVEFDNSNTRAHDWGGGEILKEVELLPGVFVLEMQWMDNFFAQGEGNGAEYNMDLWIVTETGEKVYFGNRQNVGEDPIEIEAFRVESPIVLNLMITGENIPENLPFQFVILRAPSSPFGWQFTEGNENVFSGTTILGHSAVPQNSAVGAGFFGYTPAYTNQLDILLEPFSSHAGPILGGGDAAPAFIAPDAGNTTFFGTDLPSEFDAFDDDNFPNFAGTSAAVPAAAAVNALILQGYRDFYGRENIPPAELKELIQATSLDFGDPNAGAGLMRADRALLSLANPSPDLDTLIFPENFDLTTAGTEPFILTVQMFYPILKYDENGNLVLDGNGEPIPVLDNNGTSFSLREDIQLQLESYGDKNYRWVDQGEYILEIKLEIPQFIANPSLTITNIAKADGDGGTFTVENILDKPLTEIRVKANDASKLFGEDIPFGDFSFEIQVRNGEGEWYTPDVNPLTSVEMTALTNAIELTTPATFQSLVGKLPIKINVTDQTIIDNLGESYIINGLGDDNAGWGVLTIDRLPVSYQAANPEEGTDFVETVYGEEIPFEMVYDFMSGDNSPNIAPENVEWVENFIRSSHQELLAPDTIFIIAEKGLALAEKGLALAEKGLALAEQQTYLITEKGLALAEKGLALAEKGLALVETQSAIEIGYEVAAPFLVDDEPVSPWLNEKGLALAEAQSFIDSPDNTLFFGEKGLALAEKGLALAEKGLALVEDADGNLKDSINLHFVIEATDTELNENIKSVNFVSGLDVLPEGYFQYIAPGALLNENLLATPKVVKLKITPRDINIVVNDEFPGEPYNFEKTFGEPDPEFTFAVSTQTPLRLGDDINVFEETKLSRDTGEDVGLYDILVNGLSAGSNYTIGTELSSPEDAGTPALKISPAILNVTAIDATKVYGAYDPVFGFEVSPSVDLSIFSNSLTRSDIDNENIGEYSILQGELTAGDNYTIVFTEATFTITQAPLRVWANSLEYPLYEGDPLPEFDFSFSGFIDRFGDDENTVPFTLDESVSPTNPEYFGSAGVYEIIFNYTTPNYEITQLQPAEDPGLLYVNPKDAKHIHPRLDCIEENPFYDPTITDPDDPNAYPFIAHMYYDNPLSTTVFLPISERNKLYYASTSGTYYAPDQPKYFEPGQDAGLFDVYFDGNKLIWELRSGTSSKTAAVSSDASEGSARCKQSEESARMSSSSQEISLGTFDINQIKGYPNPASDMYYVNLGSDLVVQINVSLVDIQGKMHDARFTRNVPRGRLELDLINLKTGLYLLKLDFDQEQKILKIMKR